MYESPISVYENLTHDIAKQKEDYIYQAIVKVGVDVNKEELIKALNYDREQYRKGFEDGYKESAKQFAEKLKNEIVNDIHFSQIEKDYLCVMINNLSNKLIIGGKKQ